MTREEYPVYDRMPDRTEMIVPRIDGATTLGELTDWLSYALLDRFKIEHDPVTDEIIIRTGLGLQLGGELYTIDGEE